jgi:hypothetical protein
MAGLYVQGGAAKLELALAAAAAAAVVLLSLPPAGGGGDAKVNIASGGCTAGDGGYDGARGAMLRFAICRI